MTRPIVLIADDDQTVRCLMEEALRGEVEIVTATDGIEALRLMQTLNPTLAVLDDMMPGLTGMQIVETLARATPHGYLPVIMLTGSTAVRDRMRAMTAGVIDYLTKPFIPAAVAHRVGQLLQRRRQQALIYSINPLFTTMIGHRLHLEGIAVRLAENSAEAHALCAYQHFHVVATDDRRFKSNTPVYCADLPCDVDEVVAAVRHKLNNLMMAA